MLKKYKIALIAILIISILLVWVYLFLDYSKQVNKSLYIDTKQLYSDDKTSTGWIYKKKIYKDEILDKYSLNYDLDEFKSFLEWKPTEDEDFNQIWNYFLFWKWKNNEIIDLKDCIDWKVKSEKLSGFFKDICIWENKYLKDDHVNNYHIKVQLQNLPKAYNNKDFNCGIFMNTKLDFPDEKGIISNNNLISALEFDYFSCKILKDEKYDLIADYYFYKLATDSNKCKYLKDENLKLLCEKWVENYWENYSKE